MVRGARVWQRVQRLQRVTPAKLTNWLRERLTRTARTLHWHVARSYLSARESLGWTTGLPPGSLSASSLHGLGDRDFYTRKHRLFGPIFKLFWANRQLKVCVVGFPQARRLFTEHADALAPVSIDITTVVPKGFLRCMAGTEHVNYRRLLGTALRADLVGAWSAELRTLLRAELSELAATSLSPEGPHNRTTRAIDRFATSALLAMFFGVVPTHPEFEALQRAFGRLGPDALVIPIGRAQVAAFDEIRAGLELLLRSNVEGKNPAARETVLNRVAGMSAESLRNDPTVIGNIIYMLEMGRHDMTGLLRWLLKYLSDSPAFVEQLFRYGPGSADGQELAKACVLETLRLDQAEALNRRVTADLAFEGHTIPRDSHVTVLMRETHLDAAAFDDPQRFNPHRFVGRSYSADVYAPFGLGSHRCIASDMVVQLGALFVQELVSRFSWTVVADGPRHHGTYHWEPSPLFAVELRARGG